MLPTQSIWITRGAENWQVFARKGESAVVCLEGGIRSEAVPGAVYVRVVSESDGHSVVFWTAAEQNGDSWRVELVIPTGGPYRLETCAKLPHQEFKDGIGGELRLHLFVGDLYLIAGQSNATGYARDECSDPPSVGVSVFRLNGTWDLATHPLNDGTGCQFANRDIPMPGHSPWLMFAKILNRRTGIPIGLIPAALGGSPLDAWRPGHVLYNNALEMVKNAGVPKGVLWYQGCSDAIAGEIGHYEQHFLEMVAAFRRDTGCPALPFFTCQLNGFTEADSRENDKAWASIRAQQKRCAQMEGIFLLPTAGMKLCDQIHNCAATNIRIGRQMAAQVLTKLYGQAVRWQSPAAVEIRKSVDCLEIRFAPVSGGLRIKRTVKQAFTALQGAQVLTINRCTARFDQILLEGTGLEKADCLMYAQTQNLTDAGIFDIDGDWAVAPFDIDLSLETTKNRKITITEG